MQAAFGRLEPGTTLELEATVDGQRASRFRARWAETFAQVGDGEPLVYEDSYGRICLAINQAAAAERLGLAEDARLLVRRA